MLITQAINQQEQFHDTISLVFWISPQLISDQSTTGGQYDLIEGYFPPGTQTPPHRHTRYSEQLYVLSGEFTVWAGENNAGESFLIPAGRPHVVAALSDQPARGLVVAANKRSQQISDIISFVNAKFTQMEKFYGG
ncbi:cupin domain-containing protein [Nostoc sp.]|uniref:cupin domain-containing protein n=1 Tax=Nostoc sp. TaxID=1180 RepID=UPI003FA57CB3